MGAEDKGYLGALSLEGQLFRSTLSAGPAGHVAAVLASLLVLLALLLAVLLYIKCRLNVLLWYQDTYGEVEVNGEFGEVEVNGAHGQWMCWVPLDREAVSPSVLQRQGRAQQGYRELLLAGGGREAVVPEGLGCTSQEGVCDRVWPRRAGTALGSKEGKKSRTWCMCWERCLAPGDTEGWGGETRGLGSGRG